MVEQKNGLLQRTNNINVYDINAYEKTVISQNGEDGIIEELFNRIGTTNKYFVEFGVEDGLQCNTGLLAAYKSWAGLLIEGNEDLYHRLAVNYSHLPRVTTSHRIITKDNIATIFKENGVPPEFDLLSIDIDGNDYWVWRALSGYKPRAVVIEYNAAFGPLRKWVMKYNPDHAWDGTSYYGASLTSLYELGKTMGYRLIGTDSRGVNAFFIREDVLNISKFQEHTPESGYHPPRYGAFFGGHPIRNGPYLEI